MGFGLMTVLGLLGLIGIPILIIIYIIKPKYQERKISSTYIWKLSLKYRKRKIPLQWLKSLLLIVQCIIVAVLAMLLAKPYISQAMNGYNYRKIVIIDASASMMTEKDGVTRFERAIEKACEIAETATDENTMSVIMCADVPVVVVKEESEVGNIQRILKSQKVKGTDANYATAVTEALKLANDQEAGFTLITDHDFENNGFFEVINVSQGEWNVAVDDAWEDIESDEDSKDYLEKVFYANYFSYNTQATITPCAKIIYTKGDDPTHREAQIKLPKVQLQPYDPNLDGNIIENAYAATIKFDYQSLRSAIGGRFSNYISAEFYCEDENGEIISDAFADDDKYIVMADASTEDFQVLLAGNDYMNSLWYLDTMMQSVENCYTERIIPAELTPDDMNKKSSGYDLYIYDEYIPSVLPVDGAIWFVNPPQGNYDKLGFSVSGAKTVAPSGAKVNVRGAGHAIMQGITEVTTPFKGTDGVAQEGVFSYTKYVPVAINDNSITKCVMTADGSETLIFTGETASRVKFTVFAFDLESTDFPLVFQNYPIMTQNIIDYSTDYTILNSAGRPAYGDYGIGESLTINVEPNTTKLTVSVGSGETLEEKVYQGNDLNSSVVIKLERGGVYTIKQTAMGLDSKSYDIDNTIFVRCNQDESNFALKGGALTGEDQPIGIPTDSTTKKEVIYKYFAMALLALLLIEWGLQYREQY